jgi:ubiquinone/menaquinone biosynthesis C-methylase UbiE
MASPLSKLTTKLQPSRLLPERKREVPSDFDATAITYDTLVQRNPGYLDHLRKSADRLGIANGGAGKRILDLCCGTGLSTEAVVAAAPQATVVGLDASAGMLDVARAKPAFINAGTAFVLGDASDPSPALTGSLAGPYDAILMAYGIRNLPDPDSALGRIRDLLAPGATICFHEYSVKGNPRSVGTWTSVAWMIIIPSGGWANRKLGLRQATRIYRYLWRSVLDFDSVSQFEQRLQRAGFVNIRTKPMDGWQKGIVHSFLADRPA